jgi:hypothetical protein
MAWRSCSSNGRNPDLVTADARATASLRTVPGPRVRAGPPNDILELPTLRRPAVLVPRATSNPTSFQQVSFELVFCRGCCGSSSTWD